MNKIAALFVNHEQKRLHTMWRLLLQIAAFFLLIMVSVGVASHAPNAASAELIRACLYLFGGLGFAWAMARFIDKRPFADYGLRLSPSWWIDLAFGLALGTALMSFAFFSMLSSGWVVVQSVSVTNLAIPFAAAFLIKVLVMIAVGANEELTFRGYQLRNLAESFSRFGPRRAVGFAMLVSSVVFGLLHLVNELSGGALLSPLATLNLILWGVMAALPFLLTGELSISIGLHISWNLFQGTVYGLPVSGAAPRTHLLSTLDSGPDWWTGGAYGPEGGLIGTVFILIGTIVGALYVMWRQKRRLALHAPLALYLPRAGVSSATA